MADHVKTGVSPFQSSVALMLKLHELSVQGQRDSAAAGVICAEMERSWNAMTEQEQELVGGLSEDLYAIEDGGAKQVSMTAEDKQEFVEQARKSFAAYQQGEYGQTLAFLRQPSPTGLPRHTVPFLQAQCWERLGEVEAAILFMKEAERFDPSLAISVLLLLQKTTHTGEIATYANRIVGNRFAELLAAG